MDEAISKVMKVSNLFDKLRTYTITFITNGFIFYQYAVLGKLPIVGIHLPFLIRFF